MLAEFVIFSVAVGHQPGGREVKTTRFRVDITLVGNEVNNLGNKHIMAAKVDDVGDGALNRQRTFGYHITRVDNAGQRRQSGLGKFIIVAARPYAAPIGRTHHSLGRKVDGELHLASDDIIAMSLGADGYRQHGRVCTYRTDPRHCEHIGHLASRSAADKYCRGGIDHRARLPRHLSVLSAHSICAFEASTAWLQ